jgi:hypothetical protein
MSISGNKLPITNNIGLIPVKCEKITPKAKWPGKANIINIQD